MSTMMYLIIVAGLVVAAVVSRQSNVSYVFIAAGLITSALYWRQQKRSSSVADRQSAQAVGLAPAHQPDYQQEREDARVAHMDADDRAWEVASLQRNRDNEARQALADQQA